MIHRFILIFLFLFSYNLFGQFESNKHIVGPSFEFLFLCSSFQIGVNHEYGINLVDMAFDEAGKIGIGGIFRYWNYSVKD